jgi:hypothetical protein
MCKSDQGDLGKLLQDLIPALITRDLACWAELGDAPRKLSIFQHARRRA